MFYINKIVGALTNPACVAGCAVVLALLLHVLRRRRMAYVVLWGVALWLWLWATPAASRLLGVALERPWLVDGKVPRVEELPKADVIELHGGSMGDAAEVGARGEMWTSADRVWLAARLWKAQAKKVKVEVEGEAMKVEVEGEGEAVKVEGDVEGEAVKVEGDVEVEAVKVEGDVEGEAVKVEGEGEAVKVEVEGEAWRPKLFVTGKGCAESTLGLLEDFGVPTNAIVVVDDPRNTEEEVRWIEDWSKALCSKPKVLVVTSAWHMNRTMLMYAKYAPNVEAIPVPCDFENTLTRPKRFTLLDFQPSEQRFLWNCITFHEVIGILGYRWLRK